MPFWKKQRNPQNPDWYPPGTTEDTLFKYIAAANPNLDEAQKKYMIAMNGDKTLREVKEETERLQKVTAEFHKQVGAKQ